jgi:hypothetical protein
MRFSFFTELVKKRYTMSDPTIPTVDVTPLPRPAPVVAPYNLRSAQQSLIDPVTLLKLHPEQTKKPVYYYTKPKAADNAANRAQVHHTNSLNNMAGSKQFQKGVRVKGVVSRHSKQGIKLQAKRNAKRDSVVKPGKETKKGPKSQKKTGKRA